MPVPDFSPGEVLTAAAMDSISAWLVKTQTIGTGVSTVVVTDAFSANYTNYLIQISTVFSANAARCFLQCTNSTGATHAGNFYFFDTSSAAINGATNGVTSAFDIGLTSSTGRTQFLVNIYNPFASLATRTNSQFSGHQYNGGGGSRDSSTNSSTGFEIIPASGTLTGGTIRVYGYRD